MTEHTMNTSIHAAFRRDIARLIEALETFPSGSRSRADQLVTAWDNFAHQLEKHHEGEETLFWPAYVELGVDPDLVAALEGEHGAMITALEAAVAAMVAFDADPSDARVAAARDAMAGLSDVLLTHLAHEERDLEPWANARHGTPQIKAAEKAVRKLHPDAGTFFTCVSDDADADVHAALRRQVPAPVLFMMIRVGGRRYRREIGSVWA